MTHGDGPDAEAEQRHWRRVQSLFHRARELEELERAGFLEQHCSGEPRLRVEVAELLAEALTQDADGAAAIGARREDLSGRRLGGYELLRILGEGSMGVIYEARQGSVQRSVALKILRRRDEVLQDGGSPEAYDRMAARFLEEAGVLGCLDHPGIVPIHELARDDEGRSYFTMRLVQGEDFRGIIDRVHRGAPGSAGWSLQRALHVIVRVCETMAFAHQRGVVHRDLKPSHVMVGSFGEVYIVDWGLAKVRSRPESRDIRIRDTDADDARTPASAPTATPLQTVDGDVIGTPAYMPPEQAQGRIDRVGTCSDVYAVGAILHHLLSGQIPHLRPGERAVAPREILERVKRGPPPPLHVFDPHVDPALAAICEKAMAPEIAARYPTMEALAGDLQAFLENRVVRAHRTGALVELAKWRQRNPALAWALGAAVLAVLAGSGAVLVVQARSNARLSDKNVELALANAAVRAERDSASEQAAIATAVSEFLDGMLRSIDPERAQGDEVTVREALDAAAQRLARSFPDQPEVEAAVRTTVGVTYRHLGRLDDAATHLAFALDARRELLGEEAPETLHSMQEYAILLRDQGRLAEAEPLMRRTVELHERTLGAEARETLRSKGNLSQLLYDRQQFEEAETLAREVLTLQDERLGPDDTDRLVSLGVLAAAHYRRGDLAEAERLFRAQHAANARLFGEEHSNTLLSAMNLVTILYADGRGDEARATGAELLQRLTAIFGPKHSNTLISTANLALLACNQGRVGEGLEQLRAVLALEREVFGDEHPETLLTLFNLAEILRRNRESAESVPLFAELLAWQREHLPVEHTDLRETLWGLCDALLATGDPSTAAALLAELLDIELRVSGPESPKTQAVERQLAACRAQLNVRSAGTDG